MQDPFRKGGDTQGEVGGEGLNGFRLKISRDVPMKKEVQLTVVGKVFRPNKKKVLAPE